MELLKLRRFFCGSVYYPSKSDIIKNEFDCTITDSRFFLL